MYKTNTQQERTARLGVLVFEATKAALSAVPHARATVMTAWVGWRADKAGHKKVLTRDARIIELSEQLCKHGRGLAAVNTRSKGREVRGRDAQQRVKRFCTHNCPAAWKRKPDSDMAMHLSAADLWGSHAHVDGVVAGHGKGRRHEQLEIAHADESYACMHECWA
jgi:hypothetical protein